jgi:hypothetical protein
MLLRHIYGIPAKSQLLHMHALLRTLRCRPRFSTHFQLRALVVVFVHVVVVRVVHVIVHLVVTIAHLPSNIVDRF